MTTGLMDSVQGRIALVEESLLGSALTAAAAAGDTTLNVDDAASFSERGGTLLLRDPDGITADTVVEYTTADLNTDTITLTTALAVAWEPDGLVLVHPWHTERAAYIRTDDDDAEDEALIARVPLSLFDRIPAGVREDGAGEMVIVDYDGSEWVIDDVLGQEPVVDGGYIDPDTMPPVVGTIQPVDALPDPATIAPGAHPVVYLKSDEKLYRYDGTAWISTVDGGDLVENSVTADALAARQVSAIHLASVIALISQLTVGLVNEDGNPLPGRRIELSPGGQYVYGSDGSPLMEIPTDESLPLVWRGDAEIYHLIVKTLTTLQETVLAQGSVMTLQQAVVAPSNPPSVSVEYESTQFTDDGLWGDRVGWATDGTHFYTARQSAGAFYFEKWDASGALVLTSSAIFGVVASIHVTPGSIHIYALYNKDGWKVQRSGTGTFSGIERWSWAEHGGYTRRPAIFEDAAAAQIIIAQSRPDNGDKVRVQRFTRQSGGAVPPEPMPLVSSVDTSFAYPYDLAGVAFGAFDLGASRYVLTTPGNTSFRSVDTSGAEVVNERWLPGTTNKVGFLWDGARFQSMDTSGKRRKYETGNRWLGDVTQTWHAAYTWANGTAQTTRSPIAQFAMSKRARLKITTPGLVAGVTEARVYLANAAPGAAPSMTLQGATTGNTSPARTMTDSVFAPLNDPTATTFSTGTPAKFVSAAKDGSGNPLTDLRGDGTAKVGQLTVGAGTPKKYEKVVKVNFDPPAVAADTNAAWDIPVPAGTCVATDEARYIRGLGPGLSWRGTQIVATDSIRLLLRNVHPTLAVDMGATEFCFEVIGL